MLKLKLLGAPDLTNGNKTLVPIKNRKDLAMLAYLARMESAGMSREKLAALLWSRREIPDARMSLRQTLKNLRKAEIASSTRFLSTTRHDVGFASPAPRTDIEDILTALSTPRLHALKRARARLPQQWAAADRSRRQAGFLFGYDNLDPVFEAWRQSEDEAIRRRFTETASDGLARLSDAGDPRLLELGMFLLGLDPADDWAHHIVIRHFCATNRPELAARHFQTYVRQLSDDPAHGPCPETKELLTAPATAVAGAVPSRSAFAMQIGQQSERFAQPPRGGFRQPGTITRSGPAGEKTFPVIQYLASPVALPSATPLTAEFVDRISRNRDLNLLETPLDRSLGTGLRKSSGPGIGFDDCEGGRFLLHTSEETPGSVLVEVRSRGDGIPVFSDIVTAGPEVGREERHNRIGHSVVRLERKIVEFYKRDPALSQTVFGKFSEVDDLTGRFDRQSGERATALLNEIEADVGTSSLLLAFRASLHLQRKLLMQSHSEDELSLGRASELATKALTLDPWHMLNHRYLGFAACYLGRQDEGLEHMLVARSLNPQDPRQLMATAETAAFADRVDDARAFAAAAKGFGRNPPRYFHGYLANIAFAGHDFEAAVTFAGQAPLESMDYRAIRIAALWQLGRTIEARAEMQTSVALLQRRNETSSFSATEIVDWMCTLIPFANPQTLHLFQQGMRAAAGN